MVIKLEFTNGRQATFDTDSKGRFTGIDKDREAMFLFNNGQIFYGYADGKVDDDGDFALKRENGDKFSCLLPFGRLVAWRYVVRRKSKEKTEKE